MNFRKRLAEIAERCGPDVCWEWPGVRVDGYGKVGANLDERGPRIWATHIAAYTIMVGPVPDGLELDHLCRNRACMNPRHLEPVTTRVNTLRSDAPTAVNARKTHCNSGHPFTPENTVIVKTKCGTGRICKTCKRAAAKVIAARVRARDPEAVKRDARERARRYRARHPDRARASRLGWYERNKERQQA